MASREAPRSTGNSDACDASRPLWIDPVDDVTAVVGDPDRPRADFEVERGRARCLGQLVRKPGSRVDASDAVSKRPHRSEAGLQRVDETISLEHILQASSPRVHPKDGAAAGPHPDRAEANGNRLGSFAFRRTS